MGQRSEIEQELAAQLSQFATASKQALRRAGEKLGHHIAIVRDQAKRSGESKDKLQRSKERWGILGSRLLYKIVGTTLDSGGELDALGQLPEAEREELANRAASGERVTASTLLSLKSRKRRKRRRSRKNKSMPTGAALLKAIERALARGRRGRFFSRALARCHWRCCSVASVCSGADGGTLSSKICASLTSNFAASGSA